MSYLPNFTLFYCKWPGGENIYPMFDNQLVGALKKLPFDKHSQYKLCGEFV
jgi:hypothetical protein